MDMNKKNKEKKGIVSILKSPKKIWKEVRNEFEEIDKNAKKYFKKVVKYKPLSSKKESKEIYIFCKGILNV